MKSEESDEHDVWAAVRSLKLPLDSEGYTKSFDLSKYTRCLETQSCSAEGLEQASAAHKFYQKFGFIVVNSVISAEEAAKTVSEVWDVLESSSKMQRGDRSTWSMWPKTTASQKTGMVCYEPVFSRQIVHNRARASVAAPFALLLQPTAGTGTVPGVPLQRLVAGADRCTLFRATANSDGVVDHPEWQTCRNNLHFDINPADFLFNESAVLDDRQALQYRSPRDLTTEGNLAVASEFGGRSLQGVLNLADNKCSDGGFVCVPGFHNVFSQWVLSCPHLTLSSMALGFGKKRKRSKRELLVRLSSLGCEEAASALAVRVTARAGSLILFDARLPHGSRPNSSSDCRVVQFVRYQPENHIAASRRRARRRLVREQLRTIHWEPREGVDMPSLLLGTRSDEHSR